MAFIVYVGKPAVTPIVANLQLMCPLLLPPTARKSSFWLWFLTVYNDKPNFLDLHLFDY